MQPPNQGKILVIRGGAIGDFILTLPVLRALKQQFSQVRVEVLGYRHIAQLAVMDGLADDVRSIEARSLAGFFARHGQLDQELSKYFESFALIISYLYDPDIIFQENIARCSPAQFVVGPHRPDENEPRHATEVFLKPLERLAIFDADAEPRLTLSGSVPLALTPGTWLAVHPGSGSESKNWPEKNWGQLLFHLMDTTSLNLLLVGGEAEGERLQRLRNSLPSQRIKLAQSLPLPELAQWLKSCLGFVGHDSGISHLAAAIGLPGLVLWGETNEAVWRPRSRKVQFVRDPRGLSSLTIARVAQRLNEIFKLS